MQLHNLKFATSVTFNGNWAFIKSIIFDALCVYLVREVAVPFHYGTRQLWTYHCGRWQRWHSHFRKVCNPISLLNSSNFSFELRFLSWVFGSSCDRNDLASERKQFMEVATSAPIRGYNRLDDDEEFGKREGSSSRKGTSFRNSVFHSLN